MVVTACITDHLETARLHTNGPLILCSGIHLFGGGQSPSCGMVRILAKDKKDMIVLIRPEIDLIGPRSDMYNVTEYHKLCLSEIEAFNQLCPEIQGYVCEVPMSTDYCFIHDYARALVHSAKSKQLWLLRAIALIPSIKRRKELAELRDIGFHGVIVPLEGDTFENALEQAKDMVLLCEQLGLSVILHPIARCINKTEATRISVAFQSQIQNGTLIAVAGFACVADSLRGRVLPWQNWEISCNLMGPVPGDEPKDISTVLDRLQQLQIGLTSEST